MHTCKTVNITVGRLPAVFLAGNRCGPCRVFRQARVLARTAGTARISGQRPSLQHVPVQTLKLCLQFSINGTYCHHNITNPRLAIYLD
jgi:hypothetical protein